MGNRIQIHFCYSYLAVLVLFTMPIKSVAQQTDEKKVLFSYTFKVVSASDQTLPEEFLVNGTVLSNQDGYPIPGVRIKKLSLQPDPQGAQTDLDGNFQLYASAGDTLEVSFVGFKSQKIIVENDNTLKVVLQEDVRLTTTDWGPSYMVHKKIYSTEVVTIKKPSFFKCIVIKIGNLFR